VTKTVASLNFDFLPKRDAMLVQLGTLAERYFLDRPAEAPPVRGRRGPTRRRPRRNLCLD
jgi:hypothetical protein